jgi:hypothetical protein
MFIDRLNPEMENKSAFAANDNRVATHSIQMDISFFGRNGFGLTLQLKFYLFNHFLLFLPLLFI